jgi:hypothetical protein
VRVLFFQVESQIGVTGLRNAVNARLVNKQLPKQNIDGLVEYATCASQTQNGVMTADIAWILSASAGHSSSATAAKPRMYVDVDVGPSDIGLGQSAPCSPGSNSFTDLGNLSARLRRSSRRSLSRLPWDNKVGLL